MAYTTTITGDEPITLADAKDYLRISHNSEDDLITSLITVAREWAESYTNKAIVEQTVVAYYDSPQRDFELPLGNATDLTSVLNGTDTVTAKLLVGNPSIVTVIGDVPISVDERQSVVITYEAGFADMPKRIQQAMKILIADMYEHREAQVIGQSVTDNKTLERLLFPARELGL